MTDLYCVYHFRTRHNSGQFYTIVYTIPFVENIHMLLTVSTDSYYGNCSLLAYLCVGIVFTP